MINIKYFDKDVDKLCKTEKGDWIDLRSRINLSYHRGDIITIPLNVAMELPDGYEAIIAPRSSTFKHYGLILVNSIGVIDNSYCGDTDEWGSVWYAVSEGTIHKNDRICQFRIQQNMPKIEFNVVDNLTNPSRHGFGSTGVK